MRTTIAIFVLLLGVARASADTTEAKKHYERGMKAYNLQDFKGALHEFQSAYVEMPDPAFLFNIGQAQRQLGEYDAAAKSYRIYLANQPDAPNRDQVHKLIDQMDAGAKEDAAKAVSSNPVRVVTTRVPSEDGDTLLMGTFCNECSKQLATDDRRQQALIKPADVSRP